MKRLDKIRSLLLDPRMVFAYMVGGAESVRQLRMRRLSLMLIKGFSNMSSQPSPKVAVSRLQRLYGELLNHKSFLKHISENKELVKGAIDIAHELYVICRLLEPNIVVETGVASGISSAFILRALHDNYRGWLYSIDIPNYDHMWANVPNLPRNVDNTLPQGRASGWIVPEVLRSRWELLIGTSKEVLPSLLSKLEKVDIFAHDSDHSYNNVIWELSQVWPYIRKGGVVIVDDIDFSGAFDDFTKSISAHSVVKWRRSGFIIKE